MEDNNKLSDYRIIIENFFGRKKGLWGITAAKYRGTMADCEKITPVTVWLTEEHVARHPLRALAEVE